MRKLTKKSLTKKLDILCSELVRKRGKCQRCGRTQYLQAAHIFGRRYRVLRWNPLNILCLCYPCHFIFAHQNPVEFVEWVRELIGEDNYQELRKIARSNIKFSLSDMEAMYNELTRTKYETPNYSEIADD